MVEVGSGSGTGVYNQRHCQQFARPLLLEAVRLIRDYRGTLLRLTDERFEHIVTQHPEVARLGLVAIEDALRHPDAVIVSSAAIDDHLYYRRHSGPDMGDKYLCVVVKSVDAFIVTAYVTARQKKGVRVWPETI